jgi:hypothetical protein
MKHAAPGAAAKVPLLSLARPLLITAEPLPIALSSLSLISLTPTPPVALISHHPGHSHSH